eukprot:TRINITY_DN859_c0_g1_i2.p1 TRINITY_DN859_c0_g1~~TRINITY_DN859_c0_g1_i2.p1  ORF type:complete len:230 (-),score=36.43 TRINITY_DN859_c0_g1_i2:144-833(-)
MFRGHKDKDNEGFLPECPTPTSQEEILALAAKLLEELSSLEFGDCWISVPFEDAGGDIVLFDRSVETSSIRGLKAVGTVPAPQKAVFDLLTDTNTKNRVVWDEGLLEYKVVNVLGENVMITKTQYSAPFPVHNREFLQLRTHKFDPSTNSYYVIHSSINYPVEPVSKGCVRAFSVSCYSIRPRPDNPEHTILTLLAQVDPKGNVPGFVVNLGKGKGAQAIQTIRKVFSK